MRIKRPSAAMVVALVALVMSMTGGAIAAVNYAKNAGKVDGYDAVKASSGAGKAAGNLVATYPGGKLKGKLPFRVLSGAASSGSVSALADAAARGRNAARLIAVPDNTATTPETVIDLELGDFQVSCFDQANQVGNENAAARITVTNDSGAPVNISRRVGVAAAEIATVENNTVHTFDVGGDNTFEIQLQGSGNKTVLVDGTARQAGQQTPDSACGIWATAILVD
jgi:hypothetical protein